MSGEALLAQLEACPLAEDWTYKIDARKTGFSIYVKFSQPHDVLDALNAAQIMAESPGKLTAALARLVEGGDAS